MAWGFLLPLIILVEGFVSIATEILTIRQLLPVAGGSVIVTSLIIGIFLLFLALGYYRGSQQQEAIRLTLQRNFFVAAIWLGIGLSYLFVTFFFYFYQRWLGPHLIYPLLIYLIVIIAPLIYRLGQTVPLTMHLAHQGESAGAIGGKTLSLSTLGSFLGAVLTSLILLQYFGVAWSLLITTLLLLALTLALAEKRSNCLQYLFGALIVTYVVFTINVSIEKNVFVLTNQYANYQVLKKPISQEKIFIINETFSSRLNKHFEGYPYIELIKKILFNDLNLQDSSILVLGAGGFTLSAQQTNNNHFIYVDIDPAIKRVVTPQFTKKINGTLIVDDARHFLQTSTLRYSAIVVDAYTDVKAIPAHLLTREYLASVALHLTPTGTAIINVVANPFLSDAYSKRIDNTIRNAFNDCMSMPLIYRNAPSNIIYLCHPLKNNDKTIYSDNRNTSTTDSF